MWPFKKKTYPPSAELRIADTWALGQAMHAGRPIIVRFNRAFESIAGHPEYGHQCGIAVPLPEAQANGLPTPAQAVALQKIEDQLLQALQIDNESFLVGVISTGGMREFVWYTRNHRGFVEKFERVRREVSGFELQCMVQEDPKWRTFKTYCPRA